MLLKSLARLTEPFSNNPALLNAKPGFLGQIPYLLFLRWLIIFGIWMRCYLDDGNSGFGEKLTLWVIGLYTFSGVIYIFITYSKPITYPNWIYSLYCSIDIIAISYLYFISGVAHSDLFLFYYLPILIAAEYFDFRGNFLLHIFITIAFSIVMFMLYNKENHSYGPLEFLYRDFIPRMLFFFTISMLTSFLRNLGRHQAKLLTHRKHELETLLEFRIKLGDILDKNEIVKLAQDEIETSLEVDKIEITIYDHAIIKGPNKPPKKDPFFHIPIKNQAREFGQIIVSRATSFDEYSQISFLNSIATIVADTLERIYLLDTFYEISAETSRSLELDSELDSILFELTDNMGFKFATISLIKKYENSIEMVKGKNVPPGWIHRSKYDLDKSSDIHVSIVKQRKGEIIDSYDPRLNREMYLRYGHEKLERIFVPIFAGEEVIGTIEVGKDKKVGQKVLNDEDLKRVQALANSRGSQVNQIRPHQLLEMIARKAMEIIGADSASIHVYQDKTPIQMAGAGKIDKEFLKKIPPSKNGMGWQAINERKVNIIDNPDHLKARKPDVFEEGIKAISAFPFEIGRNIVGVLYLHFWQERQFSISEIELEKIFAKQTAVAIQNNIFLQNSEKSHEAVSNLSWWQNTIQSLVSPNALLDNILEDVVQNLLYLFDADIVTLYQYDQHKKNFRLPPIMKGNLYEPDIKKELVLENDSLWNIVRDGKNLFVDNIDLIEDFKSPINDRKNPARFVIREKVKSFAILVLKGGISANEILGVLFVNYRNFRTFSNEDKITIQTLASLSAMAINLARLVDKVKRDLQRRGNELESIQKIARMIVSREHINDLKPFYNQVLEEAIKITDANAATIMWKSNDGNILEEKATIHPEGVSSPKKIQNLSQGIMGTSIQKKEIIYAPNVEKSPWKECYLPIIPGTKSELSIPLIDEQEVKGVIDIQSEREDGFSIEDRLFLQKLGVQILIAENNVQQFNRLEKQYSSQKTIFDFSLQLREKNYQLEDILSGLLEKITSPNGLGFSRAMLFTYKKSSGKLSGSIAIGPKNKEEALKQDTLDEEAHNSPVWSFEKFIQQWEGINIPDSIDSQAKNNTLTYAINEIIIDPKKSENALSKCLIEESYVHIKKGENDQLRNILADVTGTKDDGDEFLCLPIISTEEYSGVLLVDNRFSALKKEFQSDDIEILRVIARMASLSIEIDRLKNESLQRKIKEVMGTIIHTIKTSIQLIDAKFSEIIFFKNDPAKMEEKILELQEKISEAQETVNELLIENEPWWEKRMEPIIIIPFIKEVLNEIKTQLTSEPNINIKKTRNVQITGHRQRLRETFTELIMNAEEAMKFDETKPNKLDIHIQEIREVNGDGSFVRIDLCDNGPGVKEDLKLKIFNQYFSTKGHGKGLGLYTVKDAIEKHNGDIFEAGKFGEGARFIIKFPCVYNPEKKW